MSWSLLQRFIESDHFNNDPSLPVAYLSRYSDHVGIQYVLCSKLRQFSYEQIEFFLPQLCHLLIGVDNESMALEEFIIDLCLESVSGALLTFWLFQTYLHDLAANPNSNSFKTTRRIFNKVQNIVFGGSELQHEEKIHENVGPVMVLASIVLAGVAAPFFPKHAGPVAVGQARKPRPTDDTISDTPQVQRLGRSNTISGSTGRPKRLKPQHVRSDTEAPKSVDLADALQKRPARSSHRGKPSTKSRKNPTRDPHLSSLRNGGEAVVRLSSSSLPDFREPTIQVPDPPKTAGLLGNEMYETKKPVASAPRPSLASMTREQKVRMLRSHYFRSETQFLAALEGISNRLVAIPKLARLSALRAELALIDQDLPAEVDIPALCPATLVDGAPGQSKHHRIVRLSPAEATSLNSAERVPYLLMVEVLREDFDFDPDTDDNKRLLSTLAAEDGSSKRRLFDTTTAEPVTIDLTQSGVDSVYEPASGDLSSSNLLRGFNDDSALKIDGIMISEDRNVTPFSYNRPNSGSETFKGSSMRLSSRNFDASSRNSSPGSRKATTPNNGRVQGADQTDFSALATHMRTAAQMLAQLDISGSKRPKHEVEAIKSKIIASMQTLEEQNFADDITPSVTFDSIMANVRSSTPPAATDVEVELDGTADPANGTNAGAARMENDQITGGVQRRGDRDDPSAATFGEAWSSKKERIRRSSPYGWMKNWDLLSVIVKTGSDLRQEAFACQLIQICSKIWEDANVGVWTKKMKILVTGESSGLIETITNGVSLHSLKRSLTLSSISSGKNPKKRIATLKDHFVKTFGDVDTVAYKAAADAFMRSLAAYSILSYVLQLKDRHNGNILIDEKGHIIHIDFGFILSNSPGSVGFEAAPFKLTQDYVDVLGGVNDPGYDGFKTLCKQAFQALRKSVDNLVSVVDMMGKESKMACFQAGQAQTTAALRLRFMLHLSKEEAEGFVEGLIAKSLGSYYTSIYDSFQYRSQGIY